MPDLVGTPITPQLLRGIAETEPGEHGQQLHRLPAWARARADQQLLTAESAPAGGRLVVRTAATVLEIEAFRTTLNFAAMPPRPDGRYDLLVDGAPVASRPATGGRAVVVDPATGGLEVSDGPTGVVRFDGLPARDKVVEVWLPHQEPTELVALRTDAPVAPVPASGRRTWLHHGSSISQGSNAAGPSTTWAALAARTGGVDLVNLGFSGSMMLDPFVARVLADAPADLISLEIGINVVGGDVMRRRVFAPAVHGFLDTLRDAHPTVPLVMISPLLCPMHERTPGPGTTDFASGEVRFGTSGDPADVTPGPTGKLSLEVVRAELARVLAERSDDPHLHLLDGLDLYGWPDADAHPLPDNLHPDPDTHRLVGERFAGRVFGPGGAFAARPV